MVDRRKKLLFVSYWSPYPVINGATLRMHNFLANMRMDWDIDLLCRQPDRLDDMKTMEYIFNKITLIDIQTDAQEENRSLARRIACHAYNMMRVPENVFSLKTGYSSSFQDAVNNAVCNTKYDAIFAFASLTYGYYLGNFRNENITCDVCDSVTLYFKSMMDRCRNFREMLSLFYSYIYNIRWEKKHLNKCKKLVVISERDKEWLCKSITDSMINVVENGVDSTYYHPEIVQPGTDENLFVFTGVMNYPPNHDAMIYCIREIWPIIKGLFPQARLKIIGRYPKPELVRYSCDEKNGIEVTGEVPDIREALKGARVFLCPMMSGAGMKNKILEAFAMGIPVITTKEGSYGIEFEHEKVGYIARTPEHFASFAQELVTNHGRWEAISKSARDLIENHYAWEEKAGRLTEILLN